jgi:hypothetical protein
VKQLPSHFLGGITMSYDAIALATVLALGWLSASIFGTWAYLASESQARR